MTNQKGFMKPGHFAAACVVSCLMWWVILVGADCLKGVMA